MPGGSALCADKDPRLKRMVSTADILTAFLQVDASVASEPVLRRLGFRAIPTTTPFVWTPGEGGHSRAA